MLLPLDLLLSINARQPTVQVLAPLNDSSGISALIVHPANLVKL